MRLKPDIDKQRLVYGLQQAMKATFDETRWTELGYALGKADIIEEHPRLLRSLRWGDPDYGKCIFDVLPALLGIHLQNMEKLAAIVELEGWLWRKMPDLHRELYEDNEPEDETETVESDESLDVEPIRANEPTALTAIPLRVGLSVFLCHASEDKTKVRKLYAQLSDEGFHPWLDEEELLPGQDWQLEITKAVRKAHVVVVCMTAHSTTKAGYLQKEIKAALDVADQQPEGTIFVIPARLEACEVPDRLRRFQWVNLHEPSGFTKLVQALRQRASTLGG